MHKPRLPAIPLLTLLAAATPAGAATLFQHDMAYDEPAFLRVFSSATLPIQTFDEFRLTSASTVTSIDALLGILPAFPLNGPIEFSIWSADYSQKLVSESFQLSGMGATYMGTMFGSTGAVYRYSADVTDFNLAAGTYHLSIFDANPTDSATARGGQILFWAQSDPLVDRKSSYRDLTPNQYNGIVNGSSDLAFSIQGSAVIPVPGAAWLLGSALLAVGAAVRRRRPIGQDAGD